MRVRRKHAPSTEKYDRGTSAFGDQTNIGRDGKTETPSAKRLRPYDFGDAQNGKRQDSRSVNSAEETSCRTYAFGDDYALGDTPSAIQNRKACNAQLNLAERFSVRGKGAKFRGWKSAQARIGIYERFDVKDPSAVIDPAESAADRSARVPKRADVVEA
ncbi:hypothetical protein AXG93_4413s1220 [Marchantia polymorpha subsp. ruderalis]|uniref:Uncharacterized protein n=1 Tax=Marchantia polymorpha subsp. ruderalis TaxID=1480154 RepID=A0A176W1J6_MARPO|nr:hypothetical protein AXG93_4413s1220 [Marchantia polymorpha subsp. ruderalis]